MEVNNRVALVTGASRGIGKAIAKGFAEKDYRVIVHYNMNKAEAEKTLSELPGGSHLLVRADMADSESVQAMVDEAKENMGRIDALVNNAGVFIEHPPADTGFEDWRKAWKETIYTNLIGPANLSYFVARHMIKDAGGRIINISSRGAFRGEPDAPAYGASKAGMNSMSQSLAKALAPHNIFVYTVAPGYVYTDMVRDFLEGPEGDEIRAQSPLNRAASPEEIAGLVVYLASDAPEYLTGSIIDINGASYLRN
ncbi:MAG: SDR family oxidoreductase [candidate division Zixibacteria bacterium]|nr:SDR family oxidoreductase [candidate division Zixibacteria bacterium]NIR66362.1 SDR family oxidoreductase [candidate division Zixibacteria bacterium]NIS17983.1 SDR family oxidoreductase [candidate division Zixibacteria bacterium]NIS47964.1 SDR family oxidoreductase [candidate division Zixibacteria bacterium]NIT54266.1 SDR family oxidoreductase [candidate division Zixibacteria bacterium]